MLSSSRRRFKTEYELPWLCWNEANLSASESHFHFLSFATSWLKGERNKNITIVVFTNNLFMYEDIYCTHQRAEPKEMHSLCSSISCRISFSGAPGLLEVTWRLLNWNFINLRSSEELEAFPTTYIHKGLRIFPVTSRHWTSASDITHEIFRTKLEAENCDLFPTVFIGTLSIYTASQEWERERVSKKLYAIHNSPGIKGSRTRGAQSIFGWGYNAIFR